MNGIIITKAVILWAIGVVVVSYIDSKFGMASLVQLIILLLWLSFVCLNMATEMIKNKDHE